MGCDISYTAGLQLGRHTVSAAEHDPARRACVLLILLDVRVVASATMRRVREAVAVPHSISYP